MLLARCHHKSWYERQLQESLRQKRFLERMLLCWPYATLLALRTWGRPLENWYGLMQTYLRKARAAANQTSFGCCLLGRVFITIGLTQFGNVFKEIFCDRLVEIATCELTCMKKLFVISFNYFSITYFRLASPIA